MSRWTRRLGLTLGLVLLCLGVAETIGHWAEPGVWFWAGFLFGGAALVLVGTLWRPRPAFLPLLLLVSGAFLGSLPTMWTALVPLLAIVTCVVAVLDAGRRADEQQAAQPR